MEQYSKQFIEEITHHLNPKIKIFFSQKKDLINFTIKDFNQLVDKALNTNFKGFTNKRDLIPLISTIKNSRYRKRTRWYDSYVNDIKILNKDDPKYPLASIISTARNLSPDMYVSLFGSMTIDEIIEKEVQKAVEWKKNIKSLFIEFPGINIQSDSSILQSIMTDIIMNAWEYINSELDGNINSYLMMYPDDLVNKPLFGPVAVPMIMQNTDGSLLKNIISDENNNPIMEIEIASDKGKIIPSNSLTNFDMKLLNTAIAFSDATTFYKDRTTVINMTTLAHGIVAYNPGKSVYKKIQESCENLVKYNYTYVADGMHTYFNLFDNIVVDTNKMQVVFTFGMVLSDALIKQKLITITTPDYKILKNNLSSIICYAMKKEQIANQETLVGEYSYVFFQKNVRFSSNNKKTNIKLLKESLQEFIDNHIIINKYSVNTAGIFTIHFLKLSEAELEDLGIHSKSMINVSTKNLIKEYK